MDGAKLKNGSVRHVSWVRSRKLHARAQTQNAHMQTNAGANTLSALAEGGWDGGRGS